MPDVSGLPEADAISALEASGLVVDERAERTHQRFEAGSVIRTRPAADEVVDPGTAVDLVISVGPPATPSPEATPSPAPVLVVVPDVSGLAEAEAVEALETAGLEVGERVERTNERVAAGDVIRTRPAAGAAIDPGTAIDIIVSVGTPATPSPVPVVTPPPTPVPTLAASPLPGSPIPAADDLLARVQQAGVLRVNIRPADPGWSTIRQNGQARGYSVQVANRIAEQLGVGAAFTSEPIEDVLAGGWADRWDVSFDHLVATDARAGALAFSQPYAWEPIVFAASSTSGVGPDDVTGLAVCVAAGSIAEGWFDGSLALVDAAGGQAVLPSVGSLDRRIIGRRVPGCAPRWLGRGVGSQRDDAPRCDRRWCRHRRRHGAGGVGPDRRRGRRDRPRVRDAARGDRHRDHRAARDDGTLAQLSERALGIDVSSPPDGLVPVEPAPEETPDV